MTKIRKHKRLLLLHLLGIPIDKKYVLIYDKLREFFDFSKFKKISITDSHNDKYTCFVDEVGDIIFLFYTIKKGETTLVFNYQYAFFINKMRTPAMSKVHNAEIDEMAKEWFFYNKFELSSFYKMNKTEMYDTTLVELKALYDAGEFKI